MSERLPSPEQAADQPFWLEVRAVLRGQHRDYTTGSMARAIVLLAIPMVLEMVMESVFELADIYFVGRLGPEAISAVGAAAALIILVFAVGFGLSIGVTAMVARRIGEKDPEGAGVVSFQAIVACGAISIPISLAGIFFAPEMLRLIATPEPVIEVGSTYCAILFGTNAIILLLFVLNAIFRGAGDAMLALKVLFLANTLNIVLDPILIFGWGPFPEMGITGAAVATSIGRGIGVVYQCHLLFRGRSRILLPRRAFRVVRGIMTRLLRVSGPAVFQSLIAMASFMALFAFVNRFGEEAAAGYTVAIRIIVFALLPAWGMGNAAATLVGQNLGAGNPDRAAKSVWITSFTNMAFLSAIAVCMYLFAEQIVGVFTDDAGTLEVGRQCLRIVSYTYALFAFGMVTTQAFNGAGDTWTPTWINFVCAWIIQLPVAYALAFTADMGVAGIFAAIAISQAAIAVAGVWLFHRGSWKTRAV